MLTVGSLFSGIGGFDLGLERAGMRTVWFCEQDDYCRRVLASHWPAVPRFEDVRELRGADVERVDVLCGGFPCQDLSVAGRGAGIDGARSGLWSEYARLVSELRPRYVIVENVAALLGRGLGRVLADLAALRYDAEWDCIPASAIGAPHQRDRLWLVAYPQEPRREARCGDGLRAFEGPREGSTPRSDSSMADAQGERVEGRGSAGLAVASLSAGEGVSGRDRSGSGAHHWEVEPDVGRVADGVPDRLDRLRTLGNALVPQIAEWIGRRIIQWEGGLA